MKTDSRFNLSKTTKRMMCYITNKQMRNEFKNMMIEAQVKSLEKPVSKKNETKVH
jgi:hypothetical protein